MKNLYVRKDVLNTLRSWPFRAKMDTLFKFGKPPSKLCKKSSTKYSWLKCSFMLAKKQKMSSFKIQITYKLFWIFFWLRFYLQKIFLLKCLATTACTMWAIKKNHIAQRGREICWSVEFYLLDDEKRRARNTAFSQWMTHTAQRNCNSRLRENAIRGRGEGRGRRGRAEKRGARR